MPAWETYSQEKDLHSVLHKLRKSISRVPCPRNPVFRFKVTYKAPGARCDDADRLLLLLLFESGLDPRLGNTISHKVMSE